MKNMMQKISLKQTRLFALLALLAGFVVMVPAYSSAEGKAGGSAGAKACKAAYDKSSYATALDLCRKAAEQGDASAQFNLGRMYAEGEGVKRDYEQAHMWFNIASANGDKGASKNRDDIAGQMSEARVARAQKMAREWMQKHPKK